MTKLKKTAKNIDNSKPEEIPEGDSARMVYTESDIARSELENQLKRALADYQNLERRVSEERALLSQLSSALVVEKFLPVLDNLQSAQSHLNDEGLALVIKQFKEVLSSEGVEELEAEGREFDPHLHEAAEVVAGPDEGKIVKVLANGYKMNDRVIRPAKVVVSRKIETAQVEDNNNQEVKENPLI